MGEFPFQNIIAEQIWEFDITYIYVCVKRTLLDELLGICLKTLFGNLFLLI